MVNNGSLHYDHDRDGTHTQIAGCEAKFRNVDHDTHIAIRYERNTLTGTTFPSCLTETVLLQNWTFKLFWCFCSVDRLREQSSLESLLSVKGCHSAHRLLLWGIRGDWGPQWQPWPDFHKVVRTRYSRRWERLRWSQQYFTQRRVFWTPPRWVSWEPLYVSDINPMSFSVRCKWRVQVRRNVSPAISESVKGRSVKNSTPENFRAVVNRDWLFIICIY